MAGRKRETPAASAAEYDKRQLDRLIFFSDAVIAISMTLLALEVRLPVEAGLFSEAKLQHDLLAIANKYLAFVVSFLVIASFWIGHWRKFSFIRRADGRLVWLNIAFLMAVCCVPFVSSVLQEHGNLRTAVILYAGVVVAVALLSAVLWVYALRAGLVDPQITDFQKLRGLLPPLFTAAVFALSIAISFYDADLAKYFWLLLIPIFLLSIGREPARGQD
ncbi:MAG TPA: TMEM175 family protein [Xanthobacteraceae bacterium]